MYIGYKLARVLTANDYSEFQNGTLRGRVALSRKGDLLELLRNIFLIYADIPYCYLFSRALYFAKMEQEYFAKLNFRDLAKNT